MKIGELEQHCGNCKIIGLCGDPYSDICICCNQKLENMTEEEYLEKDKNIKAHQNRNWSNKTIEKMISKGVEYVGYEE